MISEEQKAEAKGHGIVPGAVIYCAADPYSYGTVSPYSEWETKNNPPFLIAGIDDEGGDLFALYEYDWATVKTPSTQQGLQPRDACKCSPAMQAAGKAAERAGYAIRSALVQSALDAETAMINLANAFRRLQP